MFSSSLLHKTNQSQPFFYLRYSEYMDLAINGFLTSPNYEDYESQFLRNFALVLKKHKKYLLPNLNIAYLRQCYFSTEKKYIVTFIFVNFFLERSNRGRAMKFTFSQLCCRNMKSMQARCMPNSYFIYNLLFF